MGHERVTLLPKTKRWRDIVAQIEALSPNEDDIAPIIHSTLSNVNDRFSKIHLDSSVVRCLQFIASLCLVKEHSQLQQDSQDLTSLRLLRQQTPLMVSKELKRWLQDIPPQSLEYRAISESAAMTAITKWFADNKTQQSDLFRSDKNTASTWAKLKGGSGFSELARLYFAGFTERYLSYFLDREASAALPDVSARIQFKEQIHARVDDISRHAFETSKIAQSFAAGWFNKHAKERLPDASQTRAFLSIVFGKIRDELSREGQGRETA